MHALALALALSLSSTARADVSMESLPIIFSHLSPLITYTPADAWTHDA
jgi:hypothetical protein